MAILSIKYFTQSVVPQFFLDVPPPPPDGMTRCYSGRRESVITHAGQNTLQLYDYIIREENIILTSHFSAA